MQQQFRFIILIDTTMLIHKIKGEDINNFERKQALDFLREMVKETTFVIQNKQ